MAIISPVQHKILRVTMVISIFVIATSVTFAQENQEIRVKPGHPLSEYFTLSQRFRYEQFQEGKIYYLNGRISQVHRFNYDLVDGRMLVIQITGDTVPMIPIDQKVRFYAVANEVYLNLPKDEIVEILVYGDSVQLGISQKYVVKRKERMGSNGYSSGYDPTGSAGSTHKDAITDIILRKSITYFLIDGEKVYHATRQKVLKDFSSQKKAVIKYMDDNKIDFDSLSDLKKLVQFLNGLKRQ